MGDLEDYVDLNLSAKEIMEIIKLKHKQDLEWAKRHQEDEIKLIKEEFNQEYNFEERLLRLKNKADRRVDTT